MVVNMRANLSVDELRPNPVRPRRTTIHKVGINPSNETIIGPRTRNFDPWAITNVHYYTSQPDSKVRELLKGDNRRLVLTIQATDATSGTTVVRRYTYTAHDLISGRFEPGDSLEIVPFPNYGPSEENVAPL